MPKNSQQTSAFTPRAFASDVWRTNNRYAYSIERIEERYTRTHNGIVYDPHKDEYEMEEADEGTLDALKATVTAINQPVNIAPCDENAIPWHEMSKGTRERRKDYKAFKAWEDGAVQPQLPRSTEVVTKETRRRSATVLPLDDDQFVHGLQRFGLNLLPAGQSPPPTPRLTIKELDETEEVADDDDDSRSSCGSSCSCSSGSSSSTCDCDECREQTIVDAVDQSHVSDEMNVDHLHHTPITARYDDGQTIADAVDASDVPADMSVDDLESVRSGTASPRRVASPADSTASGEVERVQPTDRLMMTHDRDGQLVAAHAEHSRRDGNVVERVTTNVTRFIPVPEYVGRGQTVQMGMSRDYHGVVERMNTAIIFERMLKDVVTRTPWSTMLPRINMFLASPRQPVASPVDIFCRSFAWFHRRDDGTSSVYEGEEPNVEQLVVMAEDVVGRWTMGKADVPQTVHVHALAMQATSKQAAIAEKETPLAITAPPPQRRAPLAETKVAQPPMFAMPATRKRVLPTLNARATPSRMSQLVSKVATDRTPITDNMMTALSSSTSISPSFTRPPLPARRRQSPGYEPSIMSQVVHNVIDRPDEASMSSRQTRRETALLDKINECMPDSPPPAKRRYY